MTLDYPLFKANTLPSGQVLDPVHSVGKNFKLTFKALNCKDFDSTVMTCFQAGNTTDGDLGIEGDTDNTKSTGIGVVVKSQKAILSSSVKAMTVPYIDEKKISFEVNLTNEDNFSEILMLLDADYSKGDIYSAAESFIQTEPQNITFGSDDCDVYIYRFKAYNKYLTDAQIINNLIVNIIENSYGKNYIKMDSEHFEALKKAKNDNYQRIYFNKSTSAIDGTIKPMMSELYDRLLNDLLTENKESPIFKHHINYVNKAHYTRIIPYEKTEPNQIVVDYIASMTDNYMMELYYHLFPDEQRVDYVSYFNDLI
jgi:hypothetical protein